MVAGRKQTSGSAGRSRATTALMIGRELRFAARSTRRAFDIRTTSPGKEATLGPVVRVTREGECCRGAMRSGASLTREIKLACEDFASCAGPYPYPSRAPAH